MRLTSLLPFALLATLATGCEQSAIIEGTLSIDPIAMPATAAPLMVIVGESDDTALAWDPHEQPGSAESDAFVPGRANYDYRWEQFGQPAHALYLAAFIDLDGDTMLDDNEPYGTYVNNPIVDAAWGTTAPATRADIVIDQ